MCAWDQVGWLCARSLHSLVAPGELGTRALWRVLPLVWFGVTAAMATPWRVVSAGLYRRMPPPPADVLEVETVAVICVVWAPSRLMVHTY